MILISFASSSPSKVSWRSFFNLARSRCSFYRCYIFLLNVRRRSFLLKRSIKKKNTCHSIAIDELNQKKNGEMEKVKKGKLENNVNVVLNSNKEQYLLDKLDEIGKDIIRIILVLLHLYFIQKQSYGGVLF